MSTEEFKAGDAVAIYTSHYGEGSIIEATIARETKTQLIVFTGVERRFRKSDLQEVGDRGSWSPTAELRRTDDPSVMKARAESEARVRCSRALTAIRKWEAGKDDHETLSAAIQALMTYRDHLAGDTK